MSGTRKLEKFELEAFGVAPEAHDSRTQKLEKFTPEGASVPMGIPTPRAETSPLVLAQARSSNIPPPVRSERARNREPDVERLRTRLARRFTTLADEVTEAFAEFRIGAGSWTAELTAPEGMSTKGGTQALQHLRLRPTRQGYQVLVGGVVNAVAKSAELRDYDHIQAIYRARFGLPLEITSGEWEQFLRKAEVVLRDEGITAERVAAPSDLLQRSGRPDVAAMWRSKAALATFAVVMLAAALVVWRVIVAL